eukprot:5111615-Amphidinium_carterae.1
MSCILSLMHAAAAHIREIPTPIMCTWAVLGNVFAAFCSARVPDAGASIDVTGALRVDKPVLESRC